MANACRYFCSSNAKIFNLLIVGPNGIGKGIFSKHIAQYFNAITVDTGQIIRNICNEHSTDHSIYDKRTVDAIKGYLRAYDSFIPDEIIVPIMTKHIENNKHKSLILDGFPRTLSQLNMFEMDKYFDVVLYLNGDYETCHLKAMNRVSCSQCGAIYSNLSLEQCKELNIPFMASKVFGICDICKGELMTRKSDSLDEIAEKRRKIYVTETLPMIECLIKNESNSMYKLIQHNIKNGRDDIPQILNELQSILDT